MVNGVFSIPLEAFDARLNGPSEVNSSCRVGLREYIGSKENRLVQFATKSLLSGNHRYNPLILCGPTGTGKTMLSSGLADGWRRQHPNSAAVFMCGADFARAYANAVDTDGLADFRRRLCAARLFVLDNVQELHRKQPAQQEFVLILDQLLGSKAAVLVTSRQQVNADSQLSAMLVSRLAAGLTVPLLPPGIPARRLLLRRLATLHQVNVPDSVLDILAGESWHRNDQSTVPELNHAIVQLGHTALANSHPIDEEMVRRFLATQSSEQMLTLRSIAEKTAKLFSIPSSQLRSPSRRRNVVRARGVAMFLSRKLTGKSLKTIGQYFGKRDHTTVLHACRKTEQIQQSDAEISAAINDLMAGFNIR